MAPEFLPKLHDLNLIMKYQRNTNCGTVYKINGLYTLKSQGHKAQRMTENYSRLKETKET